MKYFHPTKNIKRKTRIYTILVFLWYNFNLINKYTISNIKSYIDGVKATGKVTIDDIYNAINQEEHAENLRRITKEALAAIENSTNIELSLPTEKEEVPKISSHNQELFQMTSELDTKTAPSSVSTKKHETI